MIFAKSKLFKRQSRTSPVPTVSPQVRSKVHKTCAKRQSRLPLHRPKCHCHRPDFHDTRAAWKISAMNSYTDFYGNQTVPLRPDLHINYLTPWSRVLPEKQTGSQLLKKFPVFYGTRRFITAFKTARHLFLS